MKINIVCKLFICWMLTSLPFISSAQVNAFSEIDYFVKVVFPTYSINKDTVRHAETISDLNKYFKPSWVKEYVSVEVQTTHNGIVRKSFSKDGTLTTEQKMNLSTLDSDSEFKVLINYIPDNNLSANEVKDIDFTVYVNPDHDATYTSGDDALNNYLQENILNTLPYGVIDEFQLAAISFTIDQQGSVINANITNATKNSIVNEQMFQAICSMPDWIPATFDDGKIVDQQFTFTFGDLRSCSINTLSIRDHNPIEPEDEEK